MITAFNQSKYKHLPRIRTDVWNNVLAKKFKRKKWNNLVSFLKYKRHRKKPHSFLPTILKDSLPKFPTYHRYLHQNNLFIRIHIRLFFGRLQEYKIKKICSKKQSTLDFVRGIELQAPIFLYRAGLINTYTEGLCHQRQKHILINGKPKNKSLKIGDVLHFTPFYIRFLKRRDYVKQGLLNYRCISNVLKASVRKRSVVKRKEKQVGASFGPLSLAPDVYDKACQDLDNNMKEAKRIISRSEYFDLILDLDESKYMDDFKPGSALHLAMNRNTEINILPFPQDKIQLGEASMIPNRNQYINKRKINWAFGYKKFKRLNIKLREKKTRYSFATNEAFDFDVQAFRFLFFNDVYYFRHHKALPFTLPYQRLKRWYTRA